VSPYLKVKENYGELVAKDEASYDHKPEPGVDNAELVSAAPQSGLNAQYKAPTADDLENKVKKKKRN